jgi:hypothetical protein
MIQHTHERRHAAMRLGLALAMVLVAGPAFATAPCHIPGHDPNPQLSYAPFVAETVYSQAKSKRELTAGNSALGSGQHELGLTHWRTAFSLRPKIWFLGNSGRGCIVLDSVEVVWRLEDMRVDIANDYHAGSCAYAMIREHEDTHVRLTREAFARSTNDMRRTIIAALRDFAVMPSSASSAEMAVQDMVARLQSRLNPVVQDFQRESNRANAGIDTKESYARVRARCRDW